MSIDTEVFALTYVPEWIAWILILIQVPGWFSVYLWLELIMLTEFGVQLHPCFCLGYRKGPETDLDIQRHSDEESHLVAD